MQRLKSTTLVATSVLLLSLAFASLAAEPTSATTQDEVKKEVSQAVDTIRSYSVDRRDRALKEARQLLADIDRRIEQREAQLQDRWSKMTAPARERTQALLRKLRAQRNAVSEWYGGLRHSSNNAWDDMKQGFTDAFSELQAAWDEAAQEFESTE